LLAAALLALPASAGGVTFGANLQTRSANSSATCGYPPYYPGIFPLGNSCTFFSTATPTGNASETQVVPLPDPAIYGNQSGTVTAVRIKTGNFSAGPAKLTVLRAHRLFNGGEATCCIGQSETQQFSLAPNSIVNVNTNLPVESKYDANQHIYTYDTLALTVLDATTKIPAEFVLDVNGYCSSGYFPYVQVGQERFTGDYGVCGFLVLMQADMTITTPGGGGGGGGVTPNPPIPSATPTVTFPSGNGNVDGHVVRVPIKCGANAICQGILRLQNRAIGGAAAARKRKTVTYGKARFKISAGKRKVVKVKLNRRGRRLTRRKSARVYANATLGGKVFSKKIRLKRR
jgi:hypothetical protein